MANKINKDTVKTQLKSNMTNNELLDYLKSQGAIDVDTLSKLQDSEGNWKEGRQIAEMFAEFPRNTNMFIDTLVNRCVKTMFLNNRWKNKLAVLQKGTLSAGDSIQQIFVNMSERVGFDKHFDSVGGSPEKDLLGKRVPEVNVDYITVNERYKYKVSVSLEQLQMAFLNENGLSSLANELIQANYEGAEYDNYNDMYNMLFSNKALTDNDKGIKIASKGVIFQAFDKKDNEAQKMLVPVGKDIRNLVKAVRTYAGKLSFKTSDYNLSQVKRHTDKRKLVFITDPETVAEIDVNVLAQAFNVSSAEISVRTIEVHELPKGDGTGTDTFKGNVKGVLMDEDLVQFWYQLNTAEQFRNPDTLTTNHWLHQWVINGLCLFCNFVVFTDSDDATP